MCNWGNAAQFENLFWLPLCFYISLSSNTHTHTHFICVGPLTQTASLTHTHVCTLVITYAHTVRGMQTRRDPTGLDRARAHLTSLLSLCHIRLCDAACVCVCVFAHVRESLESFLSVSGGSGLIFFLLLFWARAGLSTLCSHSLIINPATLTNSFTVSPCRLYLINSPVVRAENLRFKEEGVRDVLKDVFLPWYNAYRFLVQNVQRLQKVMDRRKSSFLLQLILCSFNSSWSKKHRTTVVFFYYY